MKEATRLIAIANNYLINNDPPNPPTFDFEAFRSQITDDEFDDFMDLLQSKPPRIESYRGKFYTLDHKEKEGKLVTIMRDDCGVIHSIMSDGKVIWTKQI